MNILTEAERSLIWIPRLVFNNTDDEVESILDEKAKINVIRKVSSQRRPLRETTALSFSIVAA